jgi:soluble lytic murein transglycosylase-like protein
MSVLDFDENAARHVDELAASKGIPFGTPPDVGFFEGALGAPAKGLMRGIVAKPAKLLGDAAAPIVGPVAHAVDSTFGTNAVSNYFEGEYRKNNQLLDDLKADPATTGMAGQLLHGLFDIGSSAILFSPEGAAAMEGYAKRQELLDKGVTPGTATAAGVVTGAAFFGGIKAPLTMGAAAVGRGAQGLAANVAVGVGTNVAAGVGERGFTHDLLERAGYKDMAAQYQAYDKQSLWTEAVLGAVLSGGAGAIEARSAAKQSALDAALTVRSALQARDAAPGALVNSQSAGAHQSSLETAVAQAMAGEPVNVPAAILDAEFLRPLPTAAESPIAAAIREAYRDDLPAAARHVPSERLVGIPVEQRRGLRFDAPALNEFAAGIEQKYGLPGGLINALKNAGEQSGSGAVSPAGARGVMQFMPENLKKYGVTDASDPLQIIDAAGRYLQDTFRQYGGNIDAMIADYNGGPRQARRVLNGEVPAAAETRAYLARVRAYLGQQEPATRLARQRTPEDFANSVGRVAEVHPETALPTFRDGTAYNGDQILPFADQVIAEVPAGAAVPDVLFRIGRVDDHVAAGLRQYLPGFDGTMRDAQIDGQAISQIRQLQSAAAHDVLTRLDDGALYADEVLPNPVHPERALLVLHEAAAKSRAVTILDVAAGEKGVKVLSAKVGPARNLDAARQLKQEIEASRPPELQRRGSEAGAVPEPVAIKGASGAPNRAQGAAKGIGEGNAASHDAKAPAAAIQAVEPARQSLEAKSMAETPEVSSARAIADESGDMRITLEDGTETTARAALAQADDAIAQAKTDARAFDAAITCYLRNGS